MSYRFAPVVAALLSAGVVSQPAWSTPTIHIVVVRGVATAVSADGSVAIGSRTELLPGPFPAILQETPFRWKDGVLTDVPNSPNAIGAAGGASYDGSVFTGFRGDEAFRWENGQTTPLGSLGPPGSTSFARDISWDGAKIVGGGTGGAFIHENGAFNPIGAFAAIAVSGDGEVIVGSRPNPIPEDFREAVHWQDGVLTGLGDLDGGRFWSEANDVSQDGSVIVGFGSRNTSSLEAVRWDVGVITGLGHPGDAFQSIAHAVSADGGVVVGEATFLNSLGFTPTRAAIWDDQGARWLDDLLAQTYGLDLSAYDLQQALGISADGRTIVGRGVYYPSEDGPGQAIGWMVVIPEPTTAALVSFGLLALAATRRRR